MTITSEQLHILQHSLGVDCYGCGRQYRNRYISDPNDDLNALCGLGLMKNYGPWEVAGGSNFYAVTEAGKQVVAERRFGEWLKLKSEHIA